MHPPDQPCPRWNVPYRRNPFFTGREQELQALSRALQADNAVALAHPLGISGLGSMGKTQTALEYIYRYRAAYRAVFWVRADSLRAQILRLSERNERDQQTIVAAVLRWLRSNPAWLLVFDTIDDFSAVAPFLPSAGPGHLFLTTHSHAFAGMAQALEVRPLEPDTGALLLLRRAHALAARDPLDVAPAQLRLSARRISQEVDGLPLALDQAGAYIKEVSCSLQELLQTRGDAPQEYPDSVATTWSLSFARVKQANPAAAALLDLCAFLAPDAIPEEMLAGGAPYLDPWLHHTVDNPLLFDRAIQALLAYSLVVRNTDHVVLTIHRLVQVVLRDALPAESTRQWKQQSVALVQRVFPEEEVAHWEKCERYLPHALLCANWVEQERIVSPEAARLLNEAGSYARARARYTAAEQLTRQALAIREQHMGADHPDTAQSLNNLAVLYDYQGRYEHAEPLLMRALAICEQCLGPQHQDVARIPNNLAVLASHQGRYEQAEAWDNRALAINEKLFGPEHPRTAISLNDLATLYEYQGKYGQAESFLARAGDP